MFFTEITMHSSVKFATFYDNIYIFLFIIPIKHVMNGTQHELFSMCCGTVCNIFNDYVKKFKTKFFEDKSNSHNIKNFLIIRMLVGVKK